MSKKSSKKKTVITVLVIIGLVLILVGSFFIRDILLRQGIVEYDKKEITAAAQKYSRMIDNIISATEKNAEPFEVLAGHKGLFEKSAIVFDDNASELFRDITEQIDSLCHSYCYKIYREADSIVFDFNSQGTKSIIFSKTKIEKDSTDDILENIAENLYYYEKV